LDDPQMAANALFWTDATPRRMIDDAGLTWQRLGPFRPFAFGLIMTPLCVYLERKDELATQLYLLAAECETR